MNLMVLGRSGSDEDKIDFAIEKQKQFSENPEDPIFLTSKTLVMHHQLRKS